MKFTRRGCFGSFLGVSFESMERTLLNVFPSATRGKAMRRFMRWILLVAAGLVVLAGIVRQSSPHWVIVYGHPAGARIGCSVMPTPPYRQRAPDIEALPGYPFLRQELCEAQVT